MTLETPRAGWCADDTRFDDESLNYILSNHNLQIAMGGESCYLLKPLASGSLQTKTTVSSWDSTEPYTKVLWQLTPGLEYNVNPNTGHPDLRVQSAESWGHGGIAVWVDGSLATRVKDTSRIEMATDYVAQEDPDHTVSIVFRSGWDASAHTVEYQFRTLCACVDWQQGASTGQKQCTTCFGRGFEGGYVQYTCVANTTWGTPKNTFLVRIPRALLDIKVMEQGVIANREVRSWCMAPPNAPDVDNFDILIRPQADNPSESEGTFYEIQNEQDSRLGGAGRTGGIWLHQDFQLKLIEETDIRYKFALVT